MNPPYHNPNSKFNIVKEKYKFLSTDKTPIQPLINNDLKQCKTVSPNTLKIQIINSDWVFEKNGVSVKSKNPFEELKDIAFKLNISPVLLLSEINKSRENVLNTKPDPGLFSELLKLRDLSVVDKILLLREREGELRERLKNKIMENPAFYERLPKNFKKSLDMDFRIVLSKAKVEEIVEAIYEILEEIGFYFVKTMSGSLFLFDRGELIGYDSIIYDIIGLFNMSKRGLANMLREKILSRAQTLEEKYIEPSYKLLFKNGVLDLENWVLEPLPNSPKQGCYFKRIPYNLSYHFIDSIKNIDIEYFEEQIPKFLAFLKRLFPKSEFNKALEMLGTILIPSVVRRIFIVLGPPGVGKSTFASILSEVLGKNICSQTSLERIVNSRFNYNLRGVLVNISTEGKHLFIKSRGIIILNRLTGDRTIVYEEKFKKAVEGENRLKFLFLMNQLPMFEELDPALLERLYIIFTTEEEIGKRKPLEIVLREMKDEFPKIFEFLLWCTYRVFSDGYLNYQHDLPIEEKRGLLLKTMNPVSQFINACCKLEGREKRKILYAHYLNWARENDQHPLTHRGFYNIMRSLGYIETIIHGEYYFKGISLKENKHYCKK